MAGYDRACHLDGGLPRHSRIWFRETLWTKHFYHCLATAAAFRWGNLIKLTVDATALAVNAGGGLILPDHFIDVWGEKAGMNRAAP